LLFTTAVLLYDFCDLITETQVQATVFKRAPVRLFQECRCRRDRIRSWKHYHRLNSPAKKNLTKPVDLL
jgi:hypothetical protein